MQNNEFYHLEFRPVTRPLLINNEEIVFRIEKVKLLCGSAMGEFTASSLVDIGRVGWWGDKVSLFV